MIFDGQEGSLLAADAPHHRSGVALMGVIPMPGSSDLSLITDNVGKGRFSMPCHRSELIGSGIIPDRAQLPAAASQVRDPPREAAEPPLDRREPTSDQVSAPRRSRP